MNITLFEPISIRGRFAFGIICLERLCSAWNICNDRINSFIENLWIFTSTEHLGEWDSDIRRLLPNNDEISTYSIMFGYENLEFTQQEVLTNTIWNVMEIGQGNLYGAYNSKYSLLPLQAVLETLESYSIDLPDIELFQKTRANECQGWGYPIDKNQFKKFN